jgi:hypothetical protein
MWAEAVMNLRVSKVGLIAAALTVASIMCGGAITQTAQTEQDVIARSAAWDRTVDTAGLQPLVQSARGIFQDALLDYNSSELIGPVAAGYQIINGQKYYFLCGKLNGKNAYGGYVGADNFFLIERATGVRLIFLHTASLADLALLDFVDYPGVTDMGDDFTAYVRPSASSATQH